MREILALIAYGLLLIGGLFMTFFWGRISVRRARALRYQDLHLDTYLVIAGALTIQSISTGILFGARAFSSLVDGVSTVSKDNIISYLILLGLFMMVAAKAGFVWAIHMDRKSAVWRSYIATTILWTVVALYWAIIDPFDSFRNSSAIFSGGE